MTPFHISGGRLRACLLAIVSAVLVAGCGGDDEHCLRTDQGAFTFSVDPQLADGVRTFTAVLESEDFLAFDPPLVRYTFRGAGGGGQTVLDLPDNEIRLGLVPGRTYTVEIQSRDLDGTVIRGYALAASDSAGLAFFAVSDYRPYPDEFALVFQDGFPLEGLEVRFEGAGCDPRVEDTLEYRSITNRRLAFELGGTTIRLHQKEAGILGPWTVRVFRAQELVVKNALLNDTQVSFSFTRTEPAL